jgi:hypothetical protein
MGRGGAEHRGDGAAGAGGRMLTGKTDRVDSLRHRKVEHKVC